MQSRRKKEVKKGAGEKNREKEGKEASSVLSQFQKGLVCNHFMPNRHSPEMWISSLVIFCTVDRFFFTIIPGMGSEKERKEREAMVSTSWVCCFSPTSPETRAHRTRRFLIIFILFAKVRRSSDRDDVQQSAPPFPNAFTVNSDCDL